MDDKLMILHRTPRVLVAQTTTGDFDKFGCDLYGQFNVGLHVGDSPINALQNRAKLLKMLSELGQVDVIHWLNQVHSDNVVDIDRSSSMNAHTADALITKCRGQALAIMTADCVPVAIFDDANADASVACIHAGWQGLTNSIIAKTLSKMRASNTSASHHAVIGAHISQSAYEITRELADKIVNLVCASDLVGMDGDELYQAIIADSQDNDKCLINLDKLTRLQLENLGVQVVNESSLCTYTDPRFYSYRAQTHAKKSAAGRMATIVVKL
ncbi:peptidoglycan editing factor PgeF [Moraxella ovis]|uniref:peptidoglycan editing factor PgeF n=1 Tax=Moraxella ovis TaxID=29433 RepID=UPI000D9D5018|nr:peptidoglycan editing factor PgeF [Moraxella ovis]SPX84586.1 Laccase domain protein yfiH [Moraxella ovis]STZ05040.1 Laccase domain protein yfiH [Moraxella ovis]